MGLCGRFPFHSLLIVAKLHALTVNSISLNRNINELVSFSDLAKRARSCGQEYEDIRGARVLLNGGRHSAYLNREGLFTIPSVDNGTYVLSVIAHGYVFDHYRVDVSETHPQVSVYAFIPGTPLSSNTAAPLVYPILLTPRAKSAYFVEPEGFNPVAMLQSPMMLMMIATGGLLFLTPYLMSRMDKDSPEEVGEKKSKILATQSSITNMDINGGPSNLASNDAENKAKLISQSSPAKPKPKYRKR